MDKSSENNLNNLPEEKEEQPSQEDIKEEFSEEAKAEKKNKKDEEEYCPSIFDKPDYSYEKRKKKGKMNKQTLAIIVSLLVCVALGFGTWGVISLFPKQGENLQTESSQAEETETYIYDYSAYLDDFADNKEVDTYPELAGTEGYEKGLTLGGISEVNVNNAYESFHLVPDKVTKTQLSDDTLEEEEVTTLEWFIDSVKGQDISGVTFDYDYNKFVVQDLLKLSYKEIYVQNKNDKIEDGSMTYLEECGLDKPVASPSVTFKDGSKLTVLLGKETPVKGLYYVTVLGEASDKDLLGKPKKDDKIYITEYENIAFYLQDVTYYVERDIINAVENETTYDDEGNEITDSYFVMGELAGFDSLQITGRNTDGTIKFDVVDPNTPPYTTMYLMTSPRRQCGDVDAMTTLLTPLSDGFRAADCLSIKATQAEKELYGINDPLYQVTYVVKNITYVLTVGTKISAGEFAGNYPVMVNGNPSLMVASADILGFVNMKSLDYTSDNIFSSEIEKVKSLDVNVKGKNYGFTLIHGETNEDLVVKLDGKTVDTELFRDLYVAILEINSKGDGSHVNDAKNKSEELGLTFKYVDYNHTDKLAFYPYTDRRYSCLLNGSGDWTMYSTSIEKVIKAVEKVANS